MRGPTIRDRFEIEAERLREANARRRSIRESLRHEQRGRMARAARLKIGRDDEHLSAKDKRLMRAIGKELPIKEVAAKFQTEQLTAALIIVGVL